MTVLKQYIDDVTETCVGKQRRRVSKLMPVIPTNRRTSSNTNPNQSGIWWQRLVQGHNMMSDLSKTRYLLLQARNFVRKYFGTMHYSPSGINPLFLIYTSWFLNYEKLIRWFFLSVGDINMVDKVVLFEISWKIKIAWQSNSCYICMAILLVLSWERYNAA